MKHHIRARRIVAALGATAAAGAMSTAPAHAVPGPGPGMCQYLGTNYPVYYECTDYQPWLPYGTADNPPMGGGLPDCTGVNLHNIGCS
ncbi:hypothetical protein A5746_10890 [Mycolicibacterium conceptionense]|uniref:hypothetical protein n=1 Tax=Mycolicibacterium conceptionense TaxID=451644 RepID=UPI00097B4F2A|nr:hypothetical protein [Mycolicibacterium conceptionense]OMC01753.1 hypothetical protein A5746_10890 [Mycolicibacterium conceptionense]